LKARIKKPKTLGGDTEIKKQKDEPESLSFKILEKRKPSQSKELIYSS